MVLPWNARLAAFGVLATDAAFAAAAAVAGSALPLSAIAVITPANAQIRRATMTRLRSGIASTLDGRGRHWQFPTDRGARLRTEDVLLPKQARYQAAPRPDTGKTRDRDGPIRAPRSPRSRPACRTAALPPQPPSARDPPLRPRARGSDR